MIIARDQLISCPLAFHLAGLMQTATGYGSKLITDYKIRHNNRLYRVYACCYSNVSTFYICVKGKSVPLRIEN